MFPLTKDKELKYLYLDSCYEEEDIDEDNAFQKAMEDLYSMVELVPLSEGLETNKVNEKVCSYSESDYSNWLQKIFIFI